MWVDRKRVYVAIITICLATLLTRHVGAFTTDQLLRSRFDPAKQYKTLATEHFEITYESSLEEVASLVAQDAENIHSILSKEFNHTPRQKTHIVMVENSDRTNVFTISFPQNQIFLNPTLPLVSQDVNPYGNWLQWLLTHEYSHVLHTDMDGGGYRFLRSIGGSWVKPNMAVPQWLKEGIAVYTETKFAVGGRGRDTEYRMMMRMASYEGVIDKPVFSTPDRISELDVRSWPWVLRAYLFGYYMVAEMERQLGTDPIAKISSAGASSLPMLTDLSLHKAGLPDINRLWKDMIGHVKEESELEVEAIERKPVTEYTRLTDSGYYMRGPVISPNGKWLVATREDPENDNALLLYDINETGLSQPRVLLSRFTGYQTAFSKSSRFLVYDDFGWFRRYYLKSDLFIYDLKINKLISRSTALRARDADIHPDGKHLVFVYNEKGKNHLVLTDTGWNKFQTLYANPGYSRISSPRFSPDGKSVVFSLHDDETGGEAIDRIDLEGHLTQLTSGKYDDRHPIWTSDSKYVLFTSDRTGVFNLHAYDVQTGALYQITNLLGGAFYPCADPEQKFLYFVDYSSKGYDLARMPFNPDRWEVVSEPEAAPATDSSAAPSTGPEQEVAATAKNYSSFRFLAPQSISPSLVFRPDGVQAGVNIGAVDPLYFIHYRLSLRYDTASNQPLGSFYFYNGRHNLAWTLNASRDVFPVENEDKDYQLYSFTGAVHLPLSRHTHTWYLQAGLGGSRFGFGSSVNTSAGLSLSLVKNTIFRQLGQSFPESGTGFALSVVPMYDFTDSSPITVATFDYARWIKMPWANHHVLTPTLNLAYVHQQMGSEYFFYAGGKESFPFSLDSDYSFEGYPPNFYAADRLIRGSLQYALPIASVERGFTKLPFFLDRMNLVSSVESGILWKESEETKPFSAGVAFTADLKVGYLWETQWSFGTYWGKDGDRWNRRIVFSIALR